MNKNLKITVVGIGGVGGYVGGMLAKRYPDITLVARGKRRESLQEKGLRLHSGLNGEIEVKPGRIVESAEEIQEIQDMVIICVKNYSLEEVCQSLKGCIGQNTLVLPVMNGADTGERAQRFLGRGIVIDSVIYITAFSNPDYSVTQIGKYAEIQIGLREETPEKKEALQTAWECMKEAGLDCHISQDIQAAVWEKYIFNCGYNVITTYYMAMVEELWKDQEKCKEFRQLMEEAYQVAMAKHIHIREGYVDSKYDRFMHLDVGSTSSMKRDFEGGKASELETFSGYLVSEAERLQVPVPLSEKIYQDLKQRSIGFRI